MNSQYEVFSPWAEVDPVPVRGISPRIPDLTGKKIGLFDQDHSKTGRKYKVLSVVGQKLKERFPTAEFSWYVPPEVNRYNVVQMDNKVNKPAFEAWVKGVDAVIAAIGL